MIEFTVFGIIAIVLEAKHGDADFSPMGFIAGFLAFIGAPAVFSKYYNRLILKNQLTKTEKWGLHRRAFSRKNNTGVKEMTKKELIELITKTGLTRRQFAEKYNIKYDQIRKLCAGIRAIKGMTLIYLKMIEKNLKKEAKND